MDHWFGTDEIGRDLFVRTAQGGLYSLWIGFIVAILGDDARHDPRRDRRLTSAAASTASSRR